MLRLASANTRRFSFARVIKDLEVPEAVSGSVLRSTLFAEAALLREADCACPLASCPSHPPPPFIPESFEEPLPASAEAAAAMKAVDEGRAGGYAAAWAPRSPAIFYAGAVTSHDHLPPPPHSSATAGGWQWVGGHLQHASKATTGGAQTVIPATRLGAAALEEPARPPSARPAHMEWE